MIDPFDELERQLRDKVAGLGAATHPRRSRWLGRTPLLAVAAAGLTVTGGAFAASHMARSGQSIETQGRKIGFQAQTELGRSAPACQAPPETPAGTLSYVDEALIPVIAERVPALTRPARPTELREAEQAVRSFGRFDGPVIRGAIRLLRVRAGLDLLVTVHTNGGPFSVTNPVRCRELRRARIRELAAGRAPGVEAWALRRDRLATDDPGAQILEIKGLGGNAVGGTGISVSPEPDSPKHRVPYGLLMSGGGSYTGLASPRADHLIVHSDRPVVAANLPRSVAIHEGLWSLKLPRSTGRVRLTEVTGTGTVLRVVNLR